MSATWQDIQRLAADFQRIQLAAGSKKLSENNCVEVVSMLIASNAVDIVFTTDGKEYVTRNHLLTEVKNECIGRGGRVSLSDLARALCVDYEHIENAVSVILKHSSAFMLCNAELISKDYIDILCKELNERLSDVGVISVAQLAKMWDLPNEILDGVILVAVGSKINALRDRDVLCTRAYLSSQRNIIRASHFELTSAFFWMLFDELDTAKEVFPKIGLLNKTGFLNKKKVNSLQDGIFQIPGKVVGSRTSGHCMYYPNIHSLLAKRYLLKTFLQDEILDLAVFKKLAIPEPKFLMKDLLKDVEHSGLVYFPSAVISGRLWDQTVHSINEEINTKSCVDVTKHLPERIQNAADVEHAIVSLTKSNKDWLFVSGQPYIYNQQLLSSTVKTLDDFINARAEELAASWGKQQKMCKKGEK
ncbi:unnamed protein product, partial [Gongylonema pulchrum]|uniref:E3 UFM1-protein ligase 1 homolog n=1 Tax=Gongylonema pulchrum TaxID=637853 RepID=A0A183E7E7_9BILA